MLNFIDGGVCAAQGFKAAGIHVGVKTHATWKKDVALIGGIAKGSGMIHPNMGTMLCFLTTDCAISPKMIKATLLETANVSFNRISVDGDTSTNDSCIVLANGLAGNPVITEKDEDYMAFLEVIQALCVKLAKKMASDGEDANWGRVLCAMGYSGETFDPDQMDVHFASSAGDIAVCEKGRGLDFDEDLAKKILTEHDVEIFITLGEGSGQCTCWGCDITYDYIEALNLPCFGKTRGMGLMIGIAVSDGYNKSEIANKLIENGLLVLTAGPGMRLLPPLTITKAEMDQGLAIMEKTLKNC